MYGIRVVVLDSGDGVMVSLYFWEIANIEEITKTLYEKLAETYYKEEVYGHEV